MPGFGGGSFGYGPFGRHDWAKHVLFNDLPYPDRQLDAVTGRRLEKFADSIKPSFDFLLKKTMNFGDLRDADRVRTQFNENIAVEIVSSVAAGRVIEVTLLNTDPLDPFDPLGGSGVGWILEDASGREYRVNAVHKTQPHVVEVTGVTELPTNGAATLRPPALIDLLGADYGIEVDRHEPEAFQRSSVRNAVQWFDLKGSAKSYDILGKIAGYRVSALGLWSLEGTFDAIPSTHVFELPAGSGLFYTDMSPLRPLYDDVAADVVPADVMCWETSGSDGTWDTEPPGGVPDGTTLGEAIGWSMNSTPISSLTSLGGGRWRVEVGPGADLSPIAGLGRWHVVPAGTPAAKWYLETLPIETSSGVWEFEVLAGSSPVFGATVDLEYDCMAVMNCGFCRASLIRIEVTPVEVLTDPNALLEGVLTRLVRKILQVVPIHVRITDIVHIVNASIPLNLSLSVSSETSMFAYGSLGYYYDIVPADELPADPDHMVVSGTVFTIP